MKKLISLFLPILLTAVFTLADHANAQNPINFGVKGGLNIANFNNIDDDLDSRAGLMAGIVLDISLPASPAGIESGLYFSQKGAETAGGDVSIKVDYLEVPVLAKINFGPPAPVSPHLVVGPYAGFNLNSETEASVGGVDVEFDDDSVNSTEFGIIGGLGADLNLVATTINVQARYGYGLTSVFEGTDAQNGVFSITAGIMF